ncbi:protein kinase [Nonomuraea sp. B12E4]|uniref:serine/threonine-protein kinase n=1 Tax=Nonomuraea sp. B12E4 TaxID=3153564 RepID=UPI00325EA693
MQTLTEADPAQLGEYALLGVLGRGKRSVVYLGRSAYGQVAIRLLPAGDVGAQRAMAAAAEQVTEPSAAQVLATGMHGTRLYVVSEYVEGVSLAELVRLEGPRDASHLHWLATSTAAALAAIHRAGLAHLSFEPANVMLGAHGPKVVDFGIARPPEQAVVPAYLSPEPAVVPTYLPPEQVAIPAYLSPEQVAGHPAGPASDLFSWAATMIYAATGVPPFGEDSVPAVAHRVLNTPADLSRLPPPLQPILDRCLAKQPARRPTAQQVLAFLHGEAPSRTASGPPPAYAPPKNSSGVVVGLVAGLVVFLAVAATGAAFLLDRQRQEPVTVAGPSESPDSDPSESPDPGPSENASPGPTTGESASTGASPSPSAKATAPTPTNASVAGRWTGTYVCNQGKTALDLTITESSPGRLKATFAFEADPSNPGVPSGSFAMSGEVTGRALDLKGVRWIDRPGDYIMVDLLADLTGDRPATIRGSVLGGGCSTFTIKRS